MGGKITNTYLVFLQVSTASLILMCLANSFVTAPSFDENDRSALLVIKKRINNIQSEENTNLVTSAALKPAAATTIVWGLPFSFGGTFNFSFGSAKFCRNLGRFSSVRCSSQELVSRTAFATHGINTEISDWNFLSYREDIGPLSPLCSILVQISSSFELHDRPKAVRPYGQ